MLRLAKAACKLQGCAQAEPSSGQVLTQPSPFLALSWDSRVLMHIESLHAAFHLPGCPAHEPILIIQA